MKLLSLNVALFEENNDKLAEFIQAQQADFLCLQEVTKRIDDSVSQRSISFDSINSASNELTQSFFAPVWVLSKFEKHNFHGKEHFKFDLGGKVEFGNYIKSRFPITKGQNIFVQNHFTYVTNWSKWPEEDYRAVQVVDVNANGKELRLLNYHGIWSKDKYGTDNTLHACEIIRDLALEVSYPSIICGDFNLFPDTESINILSSHFNNLCNSYQIKTTRPQSNELSDKSRNVVDYVFVSKDIMVKTFEVIQNDVSDHLPLVIEFEM